MRPAHRVSHAFGTLRGALAERGSAALAVAHVGCCAMHADAEQFQHRAEITDCLIQGPARWRGYFVDDGLAEDLSVDALCLQRTVVQCCSCYHIMGCHRTAVCCQDCSRELVMLCKDLDKSGLCMLYSNWCCWFWLEQDVEVQ